MKWDRDVLALLDREREVRIRTTRPDDSTVGTVIWVVVDGDEAFVRSWKGDRAHWFQAALDWPDDVEMIVDGRRLPARVVSATDDESVARCSAALEAKYATSGSTPSMLRPEILNTTLRLVPR
jgi:hypothetical protein